MLRRRHKKHHINQMQSVSNLWHWEVEHNGNTTVFVKTVFTPALNTVHIVLFTYTAYLFVVISQDNIKTKTIVYWIEIGVKMPCNTNVINWFFCLMNSSFVFSFTVCKLYLFFVDSISLWLLFVYTQVDPSSAVFFPTNRKKVINNPSHIVRKKLQKRKKLPTYPIFHEQMSGNTQFIFISIRSFEVSISYGSKVSWQQTGQPPPPNH